MTDTKNVSLKRRDLLRTIGAGAAVGVASTGIARAKPTGRHVVGTKNNRGLEKAKQVASDVHRELDFGDVGQAVAGRFPEQARKALEKNPNIRYIEADGQMEAIGQTTPWGIDRTDSDATQDDGYTGDGADIAIIDSGIDSDHPDLQGNLGAGKAFAYCSGCAESWDDNNDHGTHCAGIAAAVDNSKAVVGVAPSATLHAVKVLASNGWGSYSDIAAGIQYVGDQGWDVASMSLGGSSYSYTVADAVQYATSEGVLCVAAAGNSGPCSDCVMFPATLPDVMAVSATDSNDDLASFSSTGPEIDIAAPGYSILSTVVDGTAYFSGTSMACPHVSGAAGLLMTNGYSNTEARKRLEETAEDLGLSGNEQGSGLLDVEAAMGGGGNDDTTAPSTPTNLSSPSQTASSVDLTWDASADDGSGVDHYKVYLDGTKQTEVSDTSTTVSGLESEASYDFAVSAVDGAGNESSKSGTLTETTSSGSTAVGETGSVTVDQPDPDTWHSVSLNNTYTDPIVVMNPVSFEGGQPAHTRVKNVASDGFEFRIEEWNYLDGGHITETIHYLVLEAGTHTLSDGTVLDAGTTKGNHKWKDTTFSQSFGSKPIVFSQTHTVEGLAPVITRHKNVTANGFSLRVQEEEGLDYKHRTETIGYVAIEPGTGSSYVAQKTSASVDHEWYHVDFSTSHDSPPMFLAQMQTSNGGQPGSVRYDSLTSSGVELMIQEERSADDEVLHADEEVGYLLVNSRGSITLQ